ncbi:MAG: multidrug ABC transporter ATPase [Bacteroidetes bacterium]|nr:MAG: multidrug ABC transporter ATPase [Bacteroidota bacterium]
MITIENLHVSYTTNQPVLAGLNLHLNEGEIHGIVGLNGAGKTTLLQAIAGYLKPDLGKISLKNEDKPMKTIAFLETENFFYAYITGREYLQLFKNSNFNNDQWNELFGLPLDELIDHYSTGMKKKLAIMALMRQNKPILILDEPFNGLDIESSRMLRSLLLKISQKKTIIITSHILETLTNLCDHIHYLEEGTIAFSSQKTDFHTIERMIFQRIEEKHSATIETLYPE